VKRWRVQRGEQEYSQIAALALANARDLPAEGWAFSRSEKAHPRLPRQLLHALPYLLHLTAMDGGNAKGLQEQSLPCSRDSKPCVRELSALTISTSGGRPLIPIAYWRTVVQP